MPEKAKKEHKCSHHVAAATSESRNVSWWRNFHFSGKVIMCSVLFGLGLVLVGSLTYAIGMDKTEEPDKADLDVIQNKAPMSIVGPVIMGIGSFTVIIGIVMCLFETSICRKRAPDARPLIEEQGTSSVIQNSGSNAIPPRSKKNDKNKLHKSRRHKTNKNALSESGSISPSSKPIDVHRSSSREFTASENFLTPPSSFVHDNNTMHSDQLKAENQTAASLMKSFTSSGKSWNTSTEFKTPSSSFEDNSWSYENKKMDAESSSSESTKSENTTIEKMQHTFVSPQNSSAELLDSDSESNDENTSQSFKDKTNKLSPMNEIRHEFVTPINSYVEKNTFPQKSIKEEIQNISSAKNEDSMDLKSKGHKENNPQDDSLENEIGEKELNIKDNESSEAKKETASSIVLSSDIDFDKNLIDSNSQNNLPNGSSNEGASDINQLEMASKHHDKKVKNVEMSTLDS